MNGMPPHCYFIRHLPIDLLVYKDEETEEWETLDWYRALRDDVRENGLVSPILVNMVSSPYNRFGKWGVSVGHHRTGVCKSLGWTHIPVVAYGAEVPLEYKPLHINSLQKARKVLRADELELKHELFWMHGATFPETKTYPTTTEPYWPTEPDE
jgi:hypothetical protein